MSRNPTIFLIILAIALVGFLAGNLMTSESDWLSFGNGNDQATILDRFNEAGRESETTPAPSVSPQDPLVTLARSRQVTSAVPSLTNTVLYYEKNSGRVYESNPSNETEKVISENILPGFISTLWSPNLKEVVTKFDQSGSAVYKYYNYDTRLATTLPAGIQSIAFSPRGNQIAYFVKGPQGGKVVISQPDGSVPKTILETRFDSATLAWPSTEFISLIAKSPLDATYDVFVVGENGSLQKILSRLDDVSMQWAPNGKKVAFSARDTDGIKLLHLYNVDDKAVVPLDISTQASRCAWSINSSTLYCPVAVSASRTDRDEIFRVDATATKLYTPKGSWRVSTLSLSLLENYLFVNTEDGRLFALPLK